MAEEQTTHGSSVGRRYDALGGRYDVWTRFFDGTVVNALRRALLSTAGGRVLEVAIGSGKNLRYYPPGCSLVGVDVSERMLSVASARATDLGRTLAALRVDATSLPFANESFDTVVCTLAGCTFADPRRVFEEMRRVCAANGTGLFLEHVRSRSPLIRSLFEGVSPLTSRLLGCHPNRDTMATIADSGWVIGRQREALRGVLVAAWAVPAPCTPAAPTVARRGSG